MSVYISREIWQEHIQGWRITDCAVRDRNIVYLCMRLDLPHETASDMWDHDIQTTIGVVYLDTPEKPFGRRILTGYNRPKLGVALQPKSQGLLAARNSNGQVSVLGGGGKFNDEYIDKGRWPMPNRVKCLFGYAYAVGSHRKIYKRVAIGRWESITDLPIGDENTKVGFKDLDAFSESDMYAVGGHGDVWHYDGRRWEQLGFPTNVQLATVTCAGDGKVYISGEGGSLWMGRGSSWERIYHGSASILWNDVLWFEDRLWLASDYQFRVWDAQKKALKPVEHEGKPVSIYGHMDARDGLLVVASQREVMAFDGRQWRVIVSPLFT